MPSGPPSPDPEHAARPGGDRDVRFIELGGPGAAGRLEAFAAAWSAAGGASGELLESADQPGLLLLVLRGAAPPGAPDPPEGARAWRFRRATPGRRRRVAGARRPFPRDR